MSDQSSTTPPATSTPKTFRTPLCGCGCGKRTGNKKARFLRGHNAKVIVFTDEHRRRIGEASRRVWEGKKVPGHKLCPACKQLKPSPDFGYRRGGDFLRSKCRLCEAEYFRRYRLEVSPEVARESHRRSRFYIEHGIREKDFLEILAAQKEVCAICGSPPDQGRRLHIDHNHSTGQIRGLLCNRCNYAISLFRENADAIRRAAVYIETASTGKVSRPRRGRRGGKAKYDRTDNPQ